VVVVVVSTAAGVAGWGTYVEGFAVLPVVDVSYAAPKAHGIVTVALHREYSLGIVFIFSQGVKDLYHV
jgi:hypothetical protein